MCSTALDNCNRAISAKEAIDAGLQSASNPMLAQLGKISDWQAIKDYREKAADLLLAVEKARDANDDALVQQYEQDMAILSRQIGSAIKPGGKLREAGDKRKNVRDSFRSNVKRVIEQQIRDTDPSLAAHLEAAITFGNSARYTSEHGVVWETRPIKNE